LVVLFFFGLYAWDWCFLRARKPTLYIFLWAKKDF
jgi:hypothetical protein